MYIVYRFHCYTSTKAMQVRAKYFCCTKVHNINTETLLCKYYANNSHSQALYKNPCGIHVLLVLSLSLSIGQLFSTVFLLSTVSTVPFLLSLVVVTVISFFKSSLRRMDTILRTNILVFLVSQSYKRRELFLTFYFIYFVN